MMAALVLAGCTSSPPVSEIPTATRPSEAPTVAPGGEASQAPLSDYDKALRYTRCMTRMGVTTKDPVVGEMLPTRPTFGRDQAPGSYEEQATGFRAGRDKCKELLPATWPVKEEPAQLAKERPFKDCLKRRGIQTYEADGNGMVHYPVDLSYLETPEYKAAESACSKYYDDPAAKVDS